MSDAHSDRVVFAEQVLGLEVFGHQAPALRSRAPYVVVAGGRRSGKTAASQVAALHCCFTRRGAQWLAISSNEQKVREYLAECLDLVRGSEFARGAVLESDSEVMRLRFSSGSEIVGVKPTAGQIRGFGKRVFGMTIDEAGFHRRGLWSDARFVLLDHMGDGAQAWMIGSPWGEPDHWFRASWHAGRDGDPDFESFQWQTAQNPRLPVEWLARERARLNHIEAAVELDGEWTDGAGAFFSRKLLDENAADLDLPGWADLSGDARLLLGVDWGVSFDRSAAVAIGRLPMRQLNPDLPPGPVFGVAAVRVWPVGAYLNDVAREVVGPAVRWAVASPEANGAGAGPSQEVIRMLGSTGRCTGRWQNPVHLTAGKKAEAYGRLRFLLEQHRLVLPRDPDLLRQLAGIRYSQGVSGAQKFEAEDEAVHDDVADALALSLGPFTDQRGKSSCFLTRCADPQAALADQWVPEADYGDQTPVLTGTGLRVLPRPILQSVDGADLTFPPRRDLPTAAKAA